MNPNHFLAVAIRYLLTHRPDWPAQRGGRQDAGQQRRSSTGWCGAWAGRSPRCRSASSGSWPGCSTARTASAARKAPGPASCAATGRSGRPTRTARSSDLLAAEITARTGKDPGEHYRELTAQYGAPLYTRIDAPATPEQKARAGKLSPDAVKATELAGEPIVAKLTRAPANGAPIGGLKVVAASGWFAARPSGTENIYKIYAESFKDQSHLDAIVDEARQIVGHALAKGTS